LRAAPDDVFIIQIETSFTQTANTHVFLAAAHRRRISSGVKTTNIGADALMQGIFLSGTKVDMIAGSSRWAVY
jgi:hypothetical protein